jgi:membrane-bound inhibitor of C-type lysozyme
MHRTIFVALGLLAAGCVPAPAEYSAGFDCGGRKVSVAGDSAEIRMNAGGKTYDMKRSVSASGERYEGKNDPTTIYWNKGSDAVVTIAGEDYPECHSTAVK